MTAQIKKLLYIGMIAFGICGFGLPALATINCTYGIDPATGSVGDSCTVSIHCTDTTGATEPVNASCNGEFTMTADGGYLFCSYGTNGCGATVTTGDVDTYTEKEVFTLANSNILSSLRAAITGGIARIIHF